MAKRSGAETPIIVAIGDTFDTAVTGGAGDKALVNNLSQSRNVGVLRENPIGGGQVLDGEDSQQGADAPTVNITKDMRYNDSGNFLVSQFFGGASAVDWGGAYCHSIFLNETANAYWNTVAAGMTTTEVQEWTSCATRSITLSVSGFPGPVVGAFDLLANERLITGTENETADLAAATVVNTKRVIARPADSFRINAQAGAALDSGDTVAITDISIAYQKPQEAPSELKGSAGNPEPVLTGDPPLKVTLSVTMRTLADFTYFTAAAAGTAYKASFEAESADFITGAIPYKFGCYFPYLKILEDPGYDLGSTADNPHTVVFEVLMPADGAYPTGMIDPYPYILIQNDRSDDLLT